MGPQRRQMSSPSPAAGPSRKRRRTTRSGPNPSQGASPPSMDDLSLKIFIRPRIRKTRFIWTTNVSTATLRDLKEHIYQSCPAFTIKGDKTPLEIAAYLTKFNRRPISNDTHLREVLRDAKSASMKGLVICVATPEKGFSSWTYETICDIYGLFTSPTLNLFPRFNDIIPIPLDFPLPGVWTEAHDRLMDQLNIATRRWRRGRGRGRGRVRRLNEARKVNVVDEILGAAESFFEQDLYVDPESRINGRRGRGPLDRSVRSLDYHTLGVVEVKRSSDDLPQGLAQIIAQLESSVTETVPADTPTSNETDDPVVSATSAPVVSNLPSLSSSSSLSSLSSSSAVEKVRELKRTSYGILTDAETWMFFKCQLFDDGNVSYNQTILEEKLDFTGDTWRPVASAILWKIVWLYSKMRNEIPAREMEAGRIY